MPSKNVEIKLPFKPILLGSAVGLGVGIITWFELERVYAGWLVWRGHDACTLYLILRSSILFGAVLGGMLSVLSDVFAAWKEDVPFWHVMGVMTRMSASIFCAMSVSMTMAHCFGLLSFAHEPVKWLHWMSPSMLVSLVLLATLIPLFLLVSELAERTILARHAWRRVAMCLAWALVAVSVPLGMNHLDRLLLTNLRAKRMQPEEEPADKPSEYRLTCDQPGCMKG